MHIHADFHTNILVGKCCISQGDVVFDREAVYFNFLFFLGEKGMPFCDCKFDSVVSRVEHLESKYRVSLTYYYCYYYYYHMIIVWWINPSVSPNISNTFQCCLNPPPGFATLCPTQGFELCCQLNPFVQLSSDSICFNVILFFGGFYNINDW